MTRALKGPNIVFNPSAAVILLIGLLGGSRGSDYSRSLAAKDLDQATLDAEGYGEKKSFKREVDGLRMTLAPGEQETGWKPPQQVRIGGDFRITANLVIKKLPKPAQEDGAAVGMAIAFQDVNQPDATLLRLREPNDSVVYRSIDKASSGQPQPQNMNPRMRMRMQMQMQMAQPGGKPPKPPRPTFPAAGDVVRMQLEREGNNVRFQVTDAATGQSRYLGQVPLGPNDVAAVKLFVSNRNGAEAIDVLWRDLTIQADRISGLGTVVRTAFDAVVYADPTSIENGVLILGGPPRTPAAAKPGDAPFHSEGFESAREAAGMPKAVAPQDAPKNKAESAAQPRAAKDEAQPATPAANAPLTVTTAANQNPAQTIRARARPGQGNAGAGPGQTQAAALAQQPNPPKPKVRIPLDEVESIRFERTPGLAARFMGQPNLDFTMPASSAAKNDATQKPDAKKAAAGDDALAPPPGTTISRILKVDPKKNGIRDLNLALSGLREAKIRQITVNCQTDKGPSGWRIDTSDSQDSPLVVLRTGTEAVADLFLEPPQGDCFQKNFMIAVMYEDGQAANATAVAGEHTDPKLAVDPKAPAVPRLDATLYLTGDEKLFGKLETIGQDTLRLTTVWQDHLDVPLSRIVGVHIGLLDRKESRESFTNRLKARGSEDLLLAQTKNGEVIAIAGIIEGTDNDKLKFRYQGRTRTLPLMQVEGLILAERPEPKQPDELLPTFSLPGGVAVSGRWKDLDTSVWKIVAPWGQELNLPAAEILSVSFRGGKMTYLGDLKPSKVEETPFFGHRLPWRRNVNLMGEPLVMNGQTYARGVAVHSRCILTYDLDGRFSTFEALVGFDEASRGKGRVVCRVFADGKELYSNPDLRADQPPVKLALAVAGAGQLRLLVDYGRGQDTGDRVIWANARLHRP
ncbi:MAG: NPCBM/NEW2 domain-containing protein [Isosphaerales bacterium]